MPRTSIGIDVAIGHFGESEVRRASLMWWCRSVHRRAREGMSKGHPLVDVEQPARVDVVQSRRGHAQTLDRPPKQHRVAYGLGCRDQEKLASVSGKRLEAPREARLDPFR